MVAHHSIGFRGDCPRAFQAIAERDAATARADAANARADAANAERDAAVEKLRQSARKMKDKGFSAADIADLTGLTADEINAL